MKKSFLILFTLCLVLVIALSAGCPRVPDQRVPDQREEAKVVPEIVPGLWAWGGNCFGQLGLGDTTHRLSPVQVGTDTDWKAVAAGSGRLLFKSVEGHTLAIKTNGTLWAWGGNRLGQLGLGDTTRRLIPTQVDGFPIGFLLLFHRKATHFLLPDELGIMVSQAFDMIGGVKEGLLTTKNLLDAIGQGSPFILGEIKLAQIDNLVVARASGGLFP